MITRELRRGGPVLCSAVAYGALAFALLCPSHALAENKIDGWTYQVTPYVWGSGLAGTIRPIRSGPTVEIDESFSDVLEHLDAAFFLFMMARKDRLVLIGDLSYSQSSADGELASGIAASGKEKQTSLTLLGGYAAVDTQDVTLDILAGIRAWDISASVDVPAVGVSESPSLTFVDPVLAARLSARLAPQWTAVGYLDVGGFDVGSKRTWQAVASINYQVSDRFSVSAGYRHLAVDYRSDGTILDFSMSGPIVGATWRF